MGQEAIVIPIMIDPKAGVAGLKALGDQALKTNADLGNATGGSTRFGDSLKAAGKNILSMIGAMNLAGGAAKVLMASFEDFIAGNYKLVNAQKLMNAAQIEAADNTRKEVVELQSLLSVAKNTELSYSQRQGALDKLVKQYPEYLNGLTLEKINTEAAAAAVDKLTSSLIRKEKVGILVKQIAELENSAANLNRLADAYNGSIGNTAAKSASYLNEQISALKNELVGLMAADSKINFGSMFGSSLKSADVKMDEVKLKPSKVKIDKIPSLQEMAAMPLNIEFPPEEAKAEAQTFAEYFSRELNAYFKTSTPTDFSLIGAPEKWDEAIKKAQQLQDIQMRQAEMMSSLLVPGAEAFIDAILNNEDALQAFFSTIGDSVKGLIKQLIAAALKAAIISALFPGGLMSGGQSIKGFGAIFKSMVGFAAGGLVTGPVSALVGEGHGTSRSNPEVIAPLDKLKSFFTNMQTGNMPFAANSRMGMAGAVIGMPHRVELFTGRRGLHGMIELETQSQRRTG